MTSRTTRRTWFGIVAWTLFTQASALYFISLLFGPIAGALWVNARHAARSASRDDTR